MDIIISIIIPIYNAEKYLKELLDSIYNQSFNKYEVLMINDGSTDRSEKICLSFAEKSKKFKYFYKKNSGISNTRNYGIQKSKGKYICFVDADDLLDINYLNDFINALKTEPAQLCCCKFEKFNKNAISLHSDKKLVIDKICIDKKKYDLLYDTYLGYVWNRLFERKIIASHNLKFNSKISMSEDLLFNFEYLKCIDKVICINKENYKYRRQISSASSNLGNAKWYTIFRTLDYLMKKKDLFSSTVNNQLIYSYIFYLYQAKFRLKYIKNTKEYMQIKENIKTRIKSLKYEKPFLTNKQKIKIFIYKYFNRLAFRIKIYKNMK